MADQPDSKKPKLNVQGDGTINILSTPGSSLEEKELENLASQQDKDQELGSSICHDGFIDIQGEDITVIEQKLKRPLYVGDVVILIKDIPQDLVFKGYSCVITEVIKSSTDLSDCQYEVTFNSWFDEDDDSRKSQSLHPEFEFPTTALETIVTGNDIVRLQDQDLRYKTFFL